MFILSGFTYVILFNDRTIKFGITQNPDVRLRQLRYTGRSILCKWLSPRHNSYDKNELLAVLKYGGEWIQPNSNVSFEDVVFFLNEKVDQDNDTTVSVYKRTEDLQLNKYITSLSEDYDLYNLTLFLKDFNIKRALSGRGCFNFTKFKETLKFIRLEKQLYEVYKNKVIFTIGFGKSARTYCVKEILEYLNKKE